MISAVAIALWTPSVLAGHGPREGPYKVLTFDSKTAHVLTMSVEREPAPPPPSGGGRGSQGRAVPGSFSILVIGK